MYKVMAEGESKETSLPMDYKLIEQQLLGTRYMSVEKYGIEKSRVKVRDYTSWESAFEKVMDKAGL